MEERPGERELFGEIDSRLAAALRRLAPNSVTTGVRRIRLEDEVDLFDTERLAIRRAVSQRRAEFAGGRILLRQLTGGREAIPIGPTRAPLMPAGWAGSVAHDQTHVVAAVGRSHEIAAIGIDIEQAAPRDTDLAEIVLRPEERALDVRHAFALKEAAYKAWSGLGGGSLEFQDVSVSTSGRTFRALIVAPRFTISGSFELVGDQWLVLAVVRSGQERAPV